jgi:hypothetical protein
MKFLMKAKGEKLNNKIGEIDVILGAWSRKTENSTGVTDAWLKFYMPDEALLDLLLARFQEVDFRGNKKSGGTLMKLVLFEYDDLEDTPPEYEESRPAMKPSQVAAIICKDQLFPIYCRACLKDVLDQMKKENLFNKADSAEETAAKVIRYTCSVNSRAELDTNEVAKIQFNDYIRKPFNAFKQQQGQS